MKSLSSYISAAVVAVTLTTAGCDVDVNETANPPTTTDGVNVDIDTPAENPIERRQEGLGNIREAIDGVDVKIDDGGVNVEVDKK